MALAAEVRADARMEAAIMSFIPVEGVLIARGDIDTLSSDEILARSVFARWDQGLLSIERFHVTQKDGLVRLDLENLRVTNPNAGNMILTMSGSFEFSRIPRLMSQSDWACRMAQITRLAHIRSIFLEWGATDAQRRATRSEFLPHFRGQDLIFNSDPDPVACRIVGELKGQGLALRDMSRTLTQVSSFLSFLDVPLDLATARADPGDMNFTLEMSSVERTDQREIPQFGIGTWRSSVTAPSSRSLGVVMLLRSFLENAQDYSVDRWVLEGWNAFHLLRPEADFSASDMRLFLPGVIPTEMHANFGRAGITHAQAAISGEVTFREPIPRFALALSLIGISDINMTARFRTRSSSATDIRRIMEGGAGGFMQTDLLDLHDLNLTFDDEGITRISMDMFGIPPGRLVEEIQVMLSDNGHEGIFFTEFLGGLSRAFRMAQASERVQFLLGAETPSAMLFPRMMFEWFSGLSSPENVQSNLIMR